MSKRPNLEMPNFMYVFYALGLIILSIGLFFSEKAKLTSKMVAGRKAYFFTLIGLLLSVYFFYKFTTTFSLWKKYNKVNYKVMIKASLIFCLFLIFSPVVAIYAPSFSGIHMFLGIVIMMYYSDEVNSSIFYE